MPTDACQWFYECEQCHAVLKPLPGEARPSAKASLATGSLASAHRYGPLSSTTLVIKKFLSYQGSICGPSGRSRPYACDTGLRICF